MGDHEFLKEINRWRDGLHRRCGRIDVIRAIEERIRNETSDTKLKLLYFMLAEENEAQGNRVAAVAVHLQNDPMVEVYRWYEEVERTSVGIDVIHALNERIDSESDPVKRRELNLILAQEYKQEQDYATSEAIYHRLFETRADDPTPLIRLAEQKLYFERDPNTAMCIIDRAIVVAYGSGNFRRHALAVKAKIALGMKDFQVVGDVLTQIMQLGFEYGYIDTGLATDFVDRLPPGRIDPEVTRQYDEHCRALAEVHRAAFD